MQVIESKNLRTVSIKTAPGALVFSGLVKHFHKHARFHVVLVSSEDRMENILKANLEKYITLQSFVKLQETSHITHVRSDTSWNKGFN